MPAICFVAPHAWPVLSHDPRIAVVGGAEVQQAILARLLAAHGYRVSMVCLDFGQPARAEVDGVSVYGTYRMDQGVPGLRFFHPRLSAMWRAMREADADIYYYRSAAMLAGVMAHFCRRHGRRSIYAGASDRDFDADVGGQLPRARDRWLFRRGIALVDRIVAQNEAQRATCLATHGREAIVIPSCYELSGSKRRAVGDVVLWVGTLHANKRPELLLALAERLPQRRFVVVGGPAAGGGAFFEEMKRRAARLPNVEFTGFLPLAQVEPWFDGARLLVNTSTYEGMPNVFLQAWARGVPTVATVDVRVPAHRVAQGVEGLANEVETLFHNAPEYEKASRACRAYFEATHSSAEVLGRYARLFDGMMR